MRIQFTGMFGGDRGWGDVCRGRRFQSRPPSIGACQLSPVPSSPVHHFFSPMYVIIYSTATSPTTSPIWIFPAPPPLPSTNPENIPLLRLTVCEDTPIITGPGDECDQAAQIQSSSAELVVGGVDIQCSRQTFQVLSYHSQPTQSTPIQNEFRRGRCEALCESMCPPSFRILFHHFLCISYPTKYILFYAAQSSCRVAQTSIPRLGIILKLPYLKLWPL